MKRWLEHYPEHISKEITIPDMSLPDMLKQSVSKFQNNTAIHFYGEETTYKELNNLVDAFTASLQDKGIKKGDRVAIMLPNCPQYVISYYGILQAGGIVTQLNPMLVGKELEYILNDSEAETIVIYEPLLPVLNQVMDNTSAKHVIKVNIEGRDATDDMATGFQSFLKSANKRPVEVDVNPREDVAVLQYTGGTTGRSKGVMLTHRNLLANIMQSYEFFKDTINIGKERYLSVIPLFHVYGMTSCMNLTVYIGAMNILLPRFDLEEVLETIKNIQPTSFPGVPTMYIALNNHPKVNEYGL
ncbi:AMP-binding protein, partial [Oceanobacillus caeni]